MTFPTITVAIPTYKREQILLDTIDQLLALETQPFEIIIVDQTPVHERHVDRRLHALDSTGKIHRLRLDNPSIPKAMNHALLQAKGDIVLFLDDDVEFTSEIVAAHACGQQKKGAILVAGQVIQSWQTVLNKQEASFVDGRESDPDAFHFNSARQCWISRFMGGNFSIKKDAAVKLGGFDENFVRVAYRFEAEFADRLVSAGHRILFYPQASLRHLKAEAGGTRSFGEHLTTILPAHAVGRYYYLLVSKNKSILQRVVTLFTGPFRAVITRFHVVHPWWIPVSFVAECSGIFWALWLYFQGPRYLQGGRNT